MDSKIYQSIYDFGRNNLYKFCDTGNTWKCIGENDNVLSDEDVISLLLSNSDANWITDDISVYHHMKRNCTLCLKSDGRLRDLFLTML